MISQLGIKRLFREVSFQNIAGRSWKAVSRSNKGEVVPSSPIKVAIQWAKSPIFIFLGEPQRPNKTFLFFPLLSCRVRRNSHNVPERFAMVHGHGLFQGRLASGPNGVAVSHFPSAVGLTCPLLSFLPPFLLPVTMSLLLRVLTRHVLPAGAAIGSSALRYDRIVESRRLREKETSARNPSADVGRSVLFFSCGTTVARSAFPFYTIFYRRFWLRNQWRAWIS